MSYKKVYILLAFLLLYISLECKARTLSRKEKEARECDILLRRLKRDASSNLLEDDDVFIENLIKSTLNREKQKCIDKYHLLEMQPQAKHDDTDDAKELRREVAKLKDLVDIIKDQRYILRTLETSSKSIDADTNRQKVTQDFSDEAIKIKEIENLRNQMRKLQDQLENSKHNTDTHDYAELIKSEKEAMVKEKLNKQQVEINNMKQLLQGILIEMKSARKQVTTTEAPPMSKPKDMAQMLEELSSLEKKLSNLQHNSSSHDSEVVAMEPPKIEEPSATLQDSPNTNDERVQSRSALSSERAAEDELDALLNLLAPEKSTSSVNSLLKSLDSDSDVELERRLQVLEKQVKHKKKKQLEEKLKNLENQLTQGSIQSKTDDNDLSDNGQIKRLLVKLLKNKKVESESKTLGDDDILDELKSLQKSIKNLSTDDDIDLFDDLEEKNGSLDVTIEKLINAGGSESSTSHRRRKLTQAQIKAIRRRIMAMKQENAESSNFESDFGMNPGNEDNYGSKYHGNPNNVAHNIHGIYFDKGFYGSYNGPRPNYDNEELGPYESGTGGSKYGNHFGNMDHFYGHSGSYSPVPTNQFGTPVYPNYGNNPTHYPVFLPNSYPNQGISAPSAYGSSKYMNSNPSYAMAASGPSAPYPTSGHYSGGMMDNYKPFFPAQHQAQGGAYNQNPNSGTPNPSEQYQNLPSANSYGPASVADLKKQIYDLQGVINTFSKPEYVEKPEDEATVYHLNQQINELKGVVNTLQDTSYSAPNAAPHPEASYSGPPSYQPPVATYESAPVAIQQVPHPEPVMEPHPAPQPQPQPPPSYAPPPPPNTEEHPNGEYQHGPDARNFDGHFRYRRAIDLHSAIHRNQDVINTLGALLGEIMGVYEDNNEVTDTETFSNAAPSMLREASDPRGVRVLDDINAKIADVRKQLDHRMFQVRRNQQLPLAVPPQLPTLPQFPRPYNRRNNDDPYNDNNYENYSYDEDKKKDKFKIKSKSPELFDKIFDKIIDKVIKKIIKAFPRIIGAIFGNLFTIDKNYEYNEGYSNNYETEYGGNKKYDHGLAETFQGMGLFGIIPMILVKLLSQLHYIFQYLQKYKFFKTFLIPAIVLLISAGAIIFLVYWMQPNEENDYKQLEYDDNYGLKNKYSYYSRTPYSARIPTKNDNDIPRPVSRTDYREPNRNIFPTYQTTMNQKKNIPIQPVNYY